MKIIKKFFELEKNDQIIFFLLFTAISNTLMAVVKLVFSITLPSLWFFINAIFNIILALSRIFAVRDYRILRLKMADNQVQKNLGFKNYLNNGIILIILGIAYFIVSVYMYYKNPQTDMHEFMTYLVALIAFYSIGSAIYGMIKYKKMHDPIIAGVKITNFANALTSIVLTQVVLLNTFGSGVDVRVANGLIGMFVSIVIMVLGIYMILGIKKYMKN